MLKPYFERTDVDETKPVATLTTVKVDNHHDKADDFEQTPEDFKDLEQTVRLKNSESLANLDSKLAHLSSDKREEFKTLVLSFKNLFPDAPNRTNAACHDVDVGDASPIKQHPYRLNLLKNNVMK